MTDRDFETIARIQHRFYVTGWRWEETTFNDTHSPNLEVCIRFSPSHNCHAFSIGDKSTSDERRYGWGRFERVDAWTQAEQFLLDEVGDVNDIQRLREYKTCWYI